MRKLVLALAALLCLPGIGFAKSAKLTQEDNVATLEFPDSWKISNIKRAKSPDEEVYVWAELVPADQIDTVQKEHDAYFEKQKVTENVGSMVAAGRCTLQLFERVTRSHRDGARQIVFGAQSAVEIFLIKSDAAILRILKCAERRQSDVPQQGMRYFQR